MHPNISFEFFFITVDIFDPKKFLETLIFLYDSVRPVDLGYEYNTFFYLYILYTLFFKEPLVELLYKHDI